MKYIVILCAIAVSFNYPFAAEILAFMVAVFGLVYYWLAFKLAAGLNQSMIVAEDAHELQSTTLSVLANALAVVTLITATPYAIIGWISVPWITLTFMTATLAWLIYFGYIEINSTEDDE